ncbi:MAG: glycosyltransferase family 4 protein [Caldilineaceae bacterium]
MNLRILLVSDHYPPFIGGAHRQSQLLAQQLAKRGHTINVVTAWQPGLPAEEQDGAITIYRLKELRTLFPRLVKEKQQRHHPPYPDPVTVWGLRRLIKRFHPDIVHSHGWFGYSCAAALLGQQIPLVLSTRDYGYGCATRTLLQQGELCDGPALRKCLTCAANFYGPTRGALSTLGVLGSRPLLRHKVKGVHSVSAFVQEIVRRDLLAGKADYRHNGGAIAARPIFSFLLPGERKPDAAQVRALPTEPFILFVGGLQPRKGLATLLEAYARLRAAPPLVLIGYDTADSPAAFPTGVTVLRNATHATVMAAWKRSAFGVMPSVWPDPSPGVVREAMVQGKAMIATAIGGTPEMIVDGQTGLLVPPGDVPALTQAMQGLTDNPQRCAAIGQAAQVYAAHFMAEVSVPQFEQLYWQVLHKQAGVVNGPVQQDYALSN